MRGYRIRMFITESFWADIVITAETWFAAEAIARGQSPIGKATLLGEA